MPEPVRLVIWDLDETFWRGTLTEGGIVYDRANHDVVIELANRGIMSSICSKNDHDTVKAILVGHGIWDYFIFPSINWQPKGVRLQTLVEHVQLRPETILFVDDNPHNLHEAMHFVPGIQTGNETIVPGLLASPLCKGKDDRSRTRLAQYKLLETRRADESVATDNAEFLRSCDIRVTIEHDIEPNLDRAIELVNRTNQLNFTKDRLPERIDKARERLRKQLSGRAAQAGLVRVTDRYGDYGYCGFYLMHSRPNRSHMDHFCFSCRILNMGVEAWLYRRLGSPKMQVVGEVLTDLDEVGEVDWIRTSEESTDDGRSAVDVQFDSVFLRGACNLMPLAHYFNLQAKSVVGEYNYIRDALPVRLEHSLMFRYAIEGLDEERLDIMRRLGFEAGDFETAFGAASGPRSLNIFSNWSDAQEIIYRHRKTGLMVPFKVKTDSKGSKDLTQLDSSQLGKLDQPVRSVLEFLQDEFEYIGSVPEREIDRNLDVILDALADGEALYVLLAPETKTAGNGVVKPLKWGRMLNRCLTEAMQRHPGKMVAIEVASFLSEETGGGGATHFDRMVYHKLYESIVARATDGERSRSGEAGERRVAAA